MEMTDSELCMRGFTVLSEAFGDVGAERFIALMNREPRDYTEWRRAHLFVNEDLDSLANRARAVGAKVREMFGRNSCVH